MNVSSSRSAISLTVFGRPRHGEPFEPFEPGLKTHRVAPIPCSRGLLAASSARKRSSKSTLSLSLPASSGWPNIPIRSRLTVGQLQRSVNRSGRVLMKRFAASNLPDAAEGPNPVGKCHPQTRPPQTTPRICNVGRHRDLKRGGTAENPP
jgi:hypothetical protein